MEGVAGMSWGEIGPWPCLTAQDEPHLDHIPPFFRASV